MLTLRLEFLDQGLLVIRLYLALIMPDTSLVCPIASRLFPVATHHIHLDAFLLQQFHCLGSMRFKGFTRLQIIQSIPFREIYILIRNGERTRLVDDESIHLTEIFEGGSILDEDLLLCRLSYSHHQGSRRRQTHSTRTGDNQYRHCTQDSLRQIGIATDYPPSQERNQGDACHHRYKHQGRLIHDALYWSLASLCLLHHLDDMCQSGVLTYLLGSQTEFALARNRAGQDLIAHSLCHRHRLTCNHRLVHVCRISGHKALGLGHHAIHRNLFSCTNLNDITTLNSGDWHLLQLLAGNQSGGLRLQAHQLLDA